MSCKEYNTLRAAQHPCGIPELQTITCTRAYGFVTVSLTICQFADSKVPRHTLLCWHLAVLLCRQDVKLKALAESHTLKMAQYFAGPLSCQPPGLGQSSI